MLTPRLWINSALLFASFVTGGGGSEYGIALVRRLRMVLGVRRNARSIDCRSTWRQHLLMVQDILRIPKEVKGDVAAYGDVSC